ncbi:hypothetical protein BHE74_00014947 [Ensete ventricosum]|uniref:Uncharacterized protein n=1 Tax=Ensete ventricosum TaxID=4639 RepID=A0A444FSL9_ENSVE|nr:hypothetical protein B296_00031215 [Ensete ventricosum]RWW25644.1 hypothetical protein GW17_00010004 [Ensete ventricosum]RWW76941.1 hypothetical protein BHE74_00014947 [Ensete ventricosum]RZR94228.1 hypothetical protein BHM03_00022890 [Ensete ventricosum]
MVRQQRVTPPLQRGTRGGWFDNDSVQLRLYKGVLGVDGPTVHNGNTRLYREALSADGPMTHNNNKGKAGEEEGKLVMC